MADYPLQSTWQEVDAAAQAFKNGVIVQTTVQAKKTSAMTAPVGVDANGKLWTTPGGSNPNGDTPAVGGGYVIPDGGIPETDLSQEVQGKLKTQTAYGFTSQAAYDRFISDYPTALKAGDIVWIGGADGDGVSTQIMYQIQNSGALQKIVTIAAATTTSPVDIADAVNAALVAAKESGEFDGTPGQDGGYYTINVEQLNSQNVKISFTPSKAGMAEILPEVITLPQGPQGKPGQDAELFKVTFSHASDGYAVDKTNAEIYAAAEGDKTVVGIDTLGRRMQLYRYSSVLAWFTALGYDHDEETFGTQVYRLESDAVTVDFGSLPDQAQLVQSVIAALPVYGGETQ